MGCLPPFSTGDSDFAGPSTESRFLTEMNILAHASWPSWIVAGISLRCDPDTRRHVYTLAGVFSAFSISGTPHIGVHH
jgi:hypothetical protein